MITYITYLLTQALLTQPMSAYGYPGAILFGTLYGLALALDGFAIGQWYHLIDIAAHRVAERRSRRNSKTPRLVKVALRAGYSDYMFYDEWREGGWREGRYWNEDYNLVLPPEAVQELIIAKHKVVCC